MIKVEKIRKEEVGGAVYDISLDGTVVNALGMNIMSNTDSIQLSNANRR